ncbi:PD-(D/E)XK nuclease family protein [Micromonospora purpureochromogenes]|uniref:PD-(D/E)XK nuclease family protein n=1 Tax=Micromonospora purpureochromogenes TaxID=47872 RepID=UPI003323D9A6
MTDPGGSADDRLESGDSMEAWEAAMVALSAEAAEIKAAGGWRRGPRTVIQALGLEQSELKLVRLLGWLLTPDGHHGLGNAVVAALLKRLDVPYSASGEVDVRLEETRFDAVDGTLTRADLVLRAGQRSVLIEAKVRASEQPEQCDRLAQLWRDERPTLVFLTPRGDLPRTARCPDYSWIPLSWSDLAEIIAGAVPRDGQSRSSTAPGVSDYVQTLALFQAEQRSAEVMATDQAADFYIKHWKKIDEWLGLRTNVLASIDAVLRDTFDRDGHPVDAPEAEQAMDPSAPPGYPTFALRHSDWGTLSICVQWQPQQKDGTPWPYVGLRAFRGASRDRQMTQLRKALQPHLGLLGWLEEGSGDAFLCWKYLEPPDGDLSRLGELCRTELERGWRELASRIDRLLAGN